MMTPEQAKHRVEAYLNKGAPPGSLAIIDARTVHKPYGWIFFFNRKEFLETGNYKKSLIGNGPIVCFKLTGRIIRLGSSFDPEKKIAEFESRLKKLRRQALVIAVVTGIYAAIIVGFLIMRLR
jgi:hypothetical protein